jgi:hypothetical protein
MTWQRPYSDLRASDAERERVVAFLREHALAGRLSNDELEDRIGLAYAAVTVGDLERLIADLPRAGHPAPRPQHQPRAERPPRRRQNVSPALIGVGIAALLLTGVPLALLAGAVAVGVAIVAVVFALSVVLGPFILVALLIVLAARRRRPSPPMRWGPTH